MSDSIQPALELPDQKDGIKRVEVGRMRLPINLDKAPAILRAFDKAYGKCIVVTREDWWIIMGIVK